MRNFLLLVLASILIAFALLWFGFAILGKWGEEAYDRWGGLTLFTLGLFALFVGDSEKFLRQWRFWAVAAVLLTGHLAAFAIVLTLVKEWRTMWFMVMVIEYPIFLFLRDRFVEPSLK